MANKVSYGMFDWVELATTDLRQAKGFYGEILGWSVKGNAIPHSSYAIAKKGDKTVCGIYELKNKDGGAAPHWKAYISVKDIEATIKQATALGASLKNGPTTVGEMGQMALLHDPTGAQISLWQYNQQQPSESAMSNEVGSFSWLELVTNDSAKSTQFYTKLFGWTSKQDSLMPSYTMFYNQDSMVCGMIEIAKGGENVPPHWLVYFSVDDCDKRTSQALQLKAKVIAEPKNIPEVGRVSILSDPQGARCAFIQLASKKSMGSMS